MKLQSVPRLRILILAAGFSTRLGQPKALARIRGHSLLRRTALMLAPLSSWPLIIVTPPRCAKYRQELRGLKVNIVQNVNRAAGLSASLRCGLARARWSAATLIVPVDLGGLQRTELLRLAGRWRMAPRSVVARRIGPRGGTPLILPRRYYSLARCLRGDIGMRELLADAGIIGRILVDMPSALRDIDTPGDLTAARRAQIPR
jgi:molybdenum cofactor cytidylyltransferase